MKRIKIEQEIRKILKDNKLEYIHSAVILLPNRVDKVIQSVKKLVYNNYRRRK